MTLFVEDVIDYYYKTCQGKPNSVDSVRATGKKIVTFKSEMK